MGIRIYFLPLVPLRLPSPCPCLFWPVAPQLNGCQSVAAAAAVPEPRPAHPCLCLCRRECRLCHTCLNEKLTTHQVPADTKLIYVTGTGHAVVTPQNWTLQNACLTHLPQRDGPINPTMCGPNFRKAAVSDLPKE